MQYDPKLMAEDMKDLASLSTVDIASEEWLKCASRLVDQISDRGVPAHNPPPPDPSFGVPIEETLDERIARAVGAYPGYVPEAEPAALETQMPICNVRRDAQIAENQRKIDAGEAITARRPPALNMDIREAYGAKSPHLIAPGGPAIASGGNLG